MQFKKPFKRKSYLIEFFVHILKPTFPYNPLNELQIITQCERKLTINREKKIKVISIYLYCYAFLMKEKIVTSWTLGHVQTININLPLVKIISA